MPDVIYPTALEIKAPILLSADDLSALDEVLTDALPNVREQQLQRVAELAEGKLKAHGFESEKSGEGREQALKGYVERITKELSTTEVEMTFQLSDGSVVKATSFREALKHDRLAEQTVSSFECKVKNGEVKAAVACGRWGSSTLEISVTPSTSEPARYELFVPLREWAARIDPPRWQKLWRSIGGFSFFIWIFLFSIALDVSGGQGANYFKRQGNELLSNGALKTPEGQQKALEILLSIECGHPAPAGPRQNSKRLWFLGLGSLIVALIVSFPPRLVIGVGRGEQKLRFWEWWIKLVSVTVPGFFISSFFFPYLVTLIKKFVT